MTQQYSAGQPDQTSIEYVRRQVLDQITWAFDRLEKVNTLAEPVAVDRRSINTPEAAVEIARPLLDGAEQERLIALLLNNKNHPIAIPLIYQGTPNSINIRVADCFREAVRVGAMSIMFLHNHPSGDPTPSPEDIKVTRQLTEAGTLLGIEVLDHIVVGDEKRGFRPFVSLRKLNVLGPLAR